MVLVRRGIQLLIMPVMMLVMLLLMGCTLQLLMLVRAGGKLRMLVRVGGMQVGGICVVYHVCGVSGVSGGRATATGGRHEHAFGSGPGLSALSAMFPLRG
jgi:hypothetical protein